MSKKALHGGPGLLAVNSDQAGRGEGIRSQGLVDKVGSPAIKSSDSVLRKHMNIIKNLCSVIFHFSEHIMVICEHFNEHNVVLINYGT